jgi:hypothetical protein
VVNAFILYTIELFFVYSEQRYKAGFPYLQNSVSTYIILLVPQPPPSDLASSDFCSSKGKEMLESARDLKKCDTETVHLKKIRV